MTGRAVKHYIKQLFYYYYYAPGTCSLLTATGKSTAEANNVNNGVSYR